MTNLLPVLRDEIIVASDVMVYRVVFKKKLNILRWEKEALVRRRCRISGSGHLNWMLKKKIFSLGIKTWLS